MPSLTSDLVREYARFHRHASPYTSSNSIFWNWQTSMTFISIWRFIHVSTIVALNNIDVQTQSPQRRERWALLNCWQHDTHTYLHVHTHVCACTRTCTHTMSKNYNQLLYCWNKKPSSLKYCSALFYSRVTYSLLLYAHHSCCPLLCKSASKLGNVLARKLLRYQQRTRRRPEPTQTPP